jgi:hypothetical protein
MMFTESDALASSVWTVPATWIVCGSGESKFAWKKPPVGVEIVLDVTRAAAGDAPMADAIATISPAPTPPRRAENLFN